MSLRHPVQVIRVTTSGIVPQRKKDASLRNCNGPGQFLVFISVTMSGVVPEEKNEEESEKFVSGK